MVKKIISITAISLSIVGSTFFLSNQDSNEISSKSLSLIIFPSSWGNSWTENKDDEFYQPTKQDYIDLAFALSERVRASRLSSGSWNTGLSSDDGPQAYLEDSQYSVWPDFLLETNNANADIERVFYMLFGISRLDENEPLSDSNYIDLFPEPFWNGQEYALEFISNELLCAIPRFLNKNTNIVEYLNGKQDEYSFSDIPSPYRFWRGINNNSGYAWSTRNISNLTWQICDPPEYSYTLPFYNTKTFWNSIGYYTGYEATAESLSREGKNLGLEKIFYDLETSYSNNIDLFEIIISTNIYQYSLGFVQYNQFTSNSIIRQTLNSSFSESLSPPFGIYKYDRFEISAISSNINTYFSLPLLCLDKNSIRTNNPSSTVSSIIDIYSPVIYLAYGANSVMVPTNLIPIGVAYPGTVDGGTNGTRIIGRFINASSIGFPRKSFGIYYSSPSGVPVSPTGNVAYHLCHYKPDWIFDTNGSYVSQCKYEYQSMSDKWKKMQVIKRALEELTFVPVEAYLTGDTRWTYHNDSSSWSSTNGEYSTRIISYTVIKEHLIGETKRTIFSAPYSYSSSKRGSALDLNGISIFLGYDKISTNIFKNISNIYCAVSGPYTPSLQVNDLDAVEKISNKYTFKEASSSSPYQLYSSDSFSLDSTSLYGLDYHYINCINIPTIDGYSWANSHLNGEYQNVNTIDDITYYTGHDYGIISFAVWLELNYILD